MSNAHARLGTIGLVGLGRELSLDIPGSGPWLVLVQVVDPGQAVVLEADLQHLSPGGGISSTTRTISVPAGQALSLPGAGRVTIRDAAAQSQYRVSVSAVPWFPPRWGAAVESLAVSGMQTLSPPAYASRGRLTLFSGSLDRPPLTSGSLEIPAVSQVLESANGAELLVDWEGWF